MPSSAFQRHCIHIRFSRLTYLSLQTTLSWRELYLCFPSTQIILVVSEVTLIPNSILLSQGDLRQILHTYFHRHPILFWVCIGQFLLPKQGGYWFITTSINLVLCMNDFSSEAVKPAAILPPLLTNYKHFSTALSLFLSTQIFTG